MRRPLRAQGYDIEQLGGDQVGGPSPLKAAVASGQLERLGSAGEAAVDRLSWLKAQPASVRPPTAAVPSVASVFYSMIPTPSAFACAC